MRKLRRLEAAVILLCNYFTVVHIVVIVAAIVLPSGWWMKLSGAMFALYLFPPACFRVVGAMHRVKPGRMPVGSLDYFVWWFGFCSQNLYSRFPVFEELLRCIPGCYSVWLRLWGAKIGRLTYWCAGVRIYDRAYVSIGDHCRFGTDVRVMPHVHVGDELLLEPVVIEDDVVVGAYSLLTAGTVLKAGQSTKAFLISPPGSVWQDNHRIAK